MQAVRASLDSATGKATEAMSGVPLAELEHGTEEAESESEIEKEVNKMVTISKIEAYRLAKKTGIKFGKHPDSGVQSPSAMTELAAIAKLAGYRKPKTASGSTGRYFYYHLARLREKRGWT